VVACVTKRGRREKRETIENEKSKARKYKNYGCKHEVKKIMNNE
jgi:hypothetical protein